MSRIPKIGFASSSDGKKQNENKMEIVFKKPAPGSAIENNKHRGVKRPSGDQLSLAEKKFKSATSNLTAATKRNTFNVVPPSRAQSKAVFQSGNSKRAVLQPIQDNGTIRGSMPPMALSSLKGNNPFKSKRPAWDLKGRMQDMEEHFSKTQEINSTLMRDLLAYNERIAALETANSVLHQDVEIKSVQSEEASSQVQKLQNELRSKTEEYEKLVKEKESEISRLNKEIQQINNKFESSKNDFENLQHTYQQETTSLKSSITQLTCSKSGLQAQLNATELLLEEQREELKTLKNMCSDKEKKNEALLEQLSALESKLREEETLRRKLHNTVQELKGNIRVYCRIRPPIPDELQRGMNVANITVTGEKMLEITQMSDINLNESDDKSLPKHEFQFDRVFQPSATQEEVFHEISQLVQSSLDGYNVCIFAYGQTGSGKTYTMEGPENIIDFSTSQDNHGLGMIPRSVEQIFKTVEDLQPKGWKYRIEALFLEIYNERIQDLLNSQNGNAKCEIKKSGTKGSDCILSNVTTSEVSSVEQVFNLLRKARINRVVAATKCNEYSSRSHYVFQMKIFGSNEITNEKCEGILNLVDLAGSERVKESRSAGERLTEAKAINKSLSNLGNVIMALSRKENHIPYRDSKLTHLLANSLGGNSKTLMFVNISPDHENLNETINSLRFATKVNHCNIGTAQKRMK